MSEPGSDNTTVKIVGIIGGVVVVIVLACGVLGWLLIRASREMMEKAAEMQGQMMTEFQDMQQSQAAVDTFLSDIRTDKLDGAYQSTTEAFKKRLSRKDFDGLVKKHPAFKESPTQLMEMNSTTPVSPQTLPSTQRHHYQAQSKDGKDSINFTITVAKEGGQMKVDQLTVSQAVNP